MIHHHTLTSAILRVPFLILLSALLLILIETPANAGENDTVEIKYSPATGIGPQKGIMRRDPSDIIRVGDQFYVWYSKGQVSNGYDATIWYATSPDGHNWTEKGESLARGVEGAWDAQSVFTPNIVVAKGKYWIFYTGVPKPFDKDTPTAIGSAVVEITRGSMDEASSKSHPVTQRRQKQVRQFPH